MLNGMPWVLGKLLEGDNRVLQVMEVAVGRVSISWWFKNFETGSCWCVSGVYGPVRREERECFWNMAVVRGLWSDPWCVVGDFNFTRFPEERSGGGRLLVAMIRLSDIIEDLELIDLLLQSGKFTWGGGQNNFSKLHLHCFLGFEAGKSSLLILFKAFCPNLSLITFLFCWRGRTSERAFSI